MKKQMHKTPNEVVHNPETSRMQRASRLSEV